MEASQQAATLAESTIAGRLGLMAKHVATLEGKLAAATLQAEIASARVASAEESNAKLDQRVSAIGDELNAERQIAHSWRTEFRQLEDHYRRLEQEYFRQQSALSNQESILTALRRETELRTMELVGQLETESKERNTMAGRIERMTKSFSWRCTAPLRWLRRQLVDPLKDRDSQGP